MKSYLLRLILVFCFHTLMVSAADVNVKGYTRKDGTYVAPHVRSSPNSTKSDNYSTKGNVNPVTGKAGTKSDAGSAGSSGPTSASSTASTGQPQSSTPSVEAKAASANLAKVTVGMTKAQVVTLIGQPNVKSEASWFYMDSGWVRFKGDAVRQIEAR